MKALASLAWKEWHEVRWFLAIALGLFVGMPIIGTLEGRVFGHFTHFYFDAAPWVVNMGLGGVLAVLISVGTVCLDLGGGREDFLRSRPLSLARWALVKYAMGLGIVLLACVLPLALELKFNDFTTSHTEIAITWYPFFWVALYSLAFLCACLVRRMAHATMLALAAMLMMYFLPVVLPFLRYFSIDWVMDRSATLSHAGSHLTLPWGAFADARQLLFAAGMLAISAIALAASVLAIVRDWRVESGTRMMYWSVGSVLLILFGSASFRLATNLPILQEIDLPRDEFPSEIRFAGNHGVVLTQRRYHSGFAHALPLEMKDGRLIAGQPISLAQQWGGRASVALNPSHPEFLYIVECDHKPPRGCMFNLVAIDLASGKQAASPVPLWDSKLDANDGPPSLYVWNDLLYAMGQKLGIVDVSSAGRPQLKSVERLEYGHVQEHFTDTRRYHSLPQLPGLGPRQRLEATRSYREMTINGDYLYNADHGRLHVFQIKSLDEKSAHFVETGRYEPSVLEEVFGEYFSGVAASEKFAYLSENYRDRNLAIHTPRLTVFDVSDPRRPRVAGHFAVPTKQSMVVRPLPDGRAIVGANKLYLVGPPPGRE